MALNWECPHCHRKWAENKKKCKCGYTRKSGEVTWWVYVYDAQGKRIRKRIGKNRDAAIAFESQLKRKKAERNIKQKIGEKVQREIYEITFEEFWPKYWLYCKRRNRDLKSKESRWRNQVKPFFGKKLLSEISAEDIRRYISKRMQDGVSNGTINREIALIKHMLNTAVRLGYLEKNPIQNKIEMLPENKDKWTYLMPWEFEKLKENINERYRDLLEFLVYSGMRIGDVLRLTWQDINMEAGFIFVRGHKTKGGKAFGIPLNKKLREILERKFLRAMQTGQISKNERVFVHGDGSSFRKAFKEALKKAGLPENIRIHDLRHTYASWLAMSGVPLQQIQALLGHAHISTTLRYAHLNPATLLPASESVVSFAQKFQSRSRNQDFPSQPQGWNFPGFDQTTESGFTYRH